MNVRNSHQRYSVKKGVPRNLTKFTGKHLCQGLFFNKVAGLMPATLFKKILWHRCFPVNFVKFLRTPFLTEHFGTTAFGILCRHNVFKVIDRDRMTSLLRLFWYLCFLKRFNAIIITLTLSVYR